MAKTKTKKSMTDEAEKVVCRNKRATHDYAIEARYEAGLVLVGSEVKSLRLGKASIAEAYGHVENDEVWLEGALINESPYANRFNHAPNRRRKLLLHREEIDRLNVKVNQRGYTLVPMAVYFRGGKAKLELGLGRGKKAYDKRDSIKERDMRRDLERDHR